MGTKTTTALATGLAIFLAQAATAQNSYRAEVVAGYTMNEDDDSPETKLSMLVLGGTFNFQPVSLEGHPWEEAAFLERSMQASAELLYVELESGPLEADGLLYGLGFRYAEKETPVAAEARFSTGTIDVDGSSFDFDVTMIDASVGYWAMPDAIVGVDYGFEEFDPNMGTGSETTRFGVFGKMVHKLDKEKAINAEARLGIANVDDGTTDEDNFEVALGGDYYFTPQYSAGAHVDFSFGDAVSEEGTTLGVRGNAWFTPQIGARVEVSQFWASDSQGFDETEFGVFLAVRF